MSPWAHLLVVGILWFISFDMKLRSLPTPFFFFFFNSVLSAHICLYGPNCLLLHVFPQQFFVFSLCSPGLVSALLVLLTIHLFRKVSLKRYFVVYDFRAK